VKAIREGRANLRDSYARVDKGEIFVHNLHISAYSHSGYASHDELRKRKLLLHLSEIRKLIGKTVERGMTLVPLRLYFKNGRAKVELALARGKKQHDKREAIRDREQRREIDRALSDRRRPR
jgi:SsrA-binding protein